MKKIYFTIIAAFVMLATGCQKDNDFDGMRLVAEGFRSNNKTVVDGNSSYWVDNDSVRINGWYYKVNVDSETGAYVNNVRDSSKYYAIYPATLCMGWNGRQTVQLTIPSTYQWAVDAQGRQILRVPMAAYGTNGSTLDFKHLTAAITVEIKNHYGFPAVVDSIRVRSGIEGTSYKLCGALDIDFENIETSAAATPSSEDNMVKMKFDNTELVINQGQTKNVQIPVRAVGDGNKFTIEVTVHKQGDPAVTKTYIQTQGTGGTLDRAQMAHAGYTVGYLFSVNNSQKVIIAMGNLQYDKTTGVWSFMDHQYSTVETAGQDVGVNYANQNIVSLFGWGTSGIEGSSSSSTATATTYQPWKTDQNNSNYNPYGTTGTSLNDGGGRADWGYNAISNGGNRENYGWRTPKGGEQGYSEWQYLIYQRAASTVNGYQDTRFAIADVNNVRGMIVFPDTYTHPSSLAAKPPLNINTHPNSATPQSYSSSEWALMEADGAIFLPVAGHRNGTIVSEVNYYGRYWTSTRGNDENTAYDLHFNVWGVETTSCYNINRSSGFSVRLVMDAQ